MTNERSSSARFSVQGGKIILSLLAGLLTGCCHPPQAGVVVVNMVPADQSDEQWQDSEPFLSISRGDPTFMVGSAFTPDRNAASTTAPVYVTHDGGQTWKLFSTLPAARMTSDITHARDAGDWFAGILKFDGQLVFKELRAADPSMAVQVDSQRNDVDQPFVQSTDESGTEYTYVGNNDFAATNGQTATVDVAVNGGAWTSVRIEHRPTVGQNAPSIRPSAARDGVIYAAFFGWRNANGNLLTSDVVVVRDDHRCVANGAPNPNGFQDLKEAGIPGTRVVQGVTIPFSNAPTLGQERIGSTLALAVDPNRSSLVFIAWADRVGNGDVYTIHVRNSSDSGVTWSGDLRTITNATNCSLAVADNGSVALLYQQYTQAGRWETRLEQTRDSFRTHQDTLLATAAGNDPPIQFLPYLGDYACLLASGGEFRGVFCSSNYPDQANFPQGVKYQRRADFVNKKLLDDHGNAVPVSIDPFYFSVPVIK